MIVIGESSKVLSSFIIIVIIIVIINFIILACALEKDLDLLPDKDNTHVGEKG
jgi:hypothetical protein